jgi:hypothetical protein
LSPPGIVAGVDGGAGFPPVDGAVEDFLRSGVLPPEPMSCVNGLPLMAGVPVLLGVAKPGASVLVRAVSGSGPLGGLPVWETVADGSGRWWVRLDPTLPDGQWCVQAAQAAAGFRASTGSDGWCFMAGSCAGAVPPTVWDTGRLRRAAPGWPAGALAFKVNGHWRYGTLRRAVEAGG